MAPKKKNQEKMSLGNFLSDQSLGSWADEMEDMPIQSSSEKAGYGGERRGFSSMATFGGDRDPSDRGFIQREQLPLPTKPPYTAHLGNLSFDVTGRDIEDFFANCEVTNVRIVEDRFDHKPKGFGYVEFRSLDGLKKALTQSGSPFQGRNIRVSVAEPPKERQEGRELNDWTRKGPLPDLPSQQPRRASDRAPIRSFDSTSDLGSERGGSRRGVPPPFEHDGKFRDFSNWERKGPPAPVTSAAAPGPRETGGGSLRGSQRSFERRPSPAWGEGRSQDGSRPPRPVPERQPTAAEQDTQWRARMKPDTSAAIPSSSPTPEASTPSSPSASVAPAPAVRPRLNLQKRTVSEVPPGDQQASAGDNKASPFGAARPIDTATRDQQIAEKRDAVKKQREEEEKVAQEKRQAEKAAAAAAKAEKTAQGATSPPPAPQENGKAPTPVASAGKKQQAESGEKENGAAAAPGRQYEILRRVTGEEDGAESTTDEPADGDDVPANGAMVDDKNVKPKEVVQDISKSQEQGGAEPTAKSLEGDGWSTVNKSGRGRHNRAASRAIAS